MELSRLVRRQIDQRVVATGNFRRAAIAVVAACVLFSGCRSYMPYAGRPLESTAAARKVIYEVLEQQPGGAVLQIEVTDEKFRVAKSRGSGFLGMEPGAPADPTSVADALREWNSP